MTVIGTTHERRRHCGAVTGRRAGRRISSGGTIR